MEKIKQFRRNQALNKFQRVVTKLNNGKESSLPKRKPILEDWQIRDLQMQEQLLKIKESARSKVNQKWEKNPFFSYRELQTNRDGSPKIKTNYINRNIENCNRD